MKTTYFRGLLFAVALLGCAINLTLAQSEQTDDAPANILALIPEKAISILFGSYPIGPKYQEVLVHVYAVPEVDKTKETAYERNDFMILNSPKCTFVVDLFTGNETKPQRINRASFKNHDGVNRMLVKWLEPRTKSGPVIAIHTGATHWQGWKVMALPKGVQGPATVTDFGYGGERDAGNFIRLDGVDEFGKMTIREDWYEDDKKGNRFYPWNGIEFVDRYRPYFVIAASVKTVEQAKTFCKRHGDGQDWEIRPSANYPKLKPGYQIVIMRRYEKLMDAIEYAKSLRKEDFQTYVKRAY